MSRYKWLKCEPVDSIAYKVYDDSYKGEKKRDQFCIKLKNYHELYIVSHALIILSKGMAGKALSHQHTEKVKPQLHKEIEAIREKLYQHGLVDEALENMSGVLGGLNQKNIVTADQHAVKLSNFVYNELLEVGASIKRAKDLRRFIKFAMISIVQNRQRYETDFFSLVQNLRYQNVKPHQNIKPLPMQSTIYASPISFSTYSSF